MPGAPVVTADSYRAAPPLRDSEPSQMELGMKDRRVFGTGPSLFFEILSC